MLRAPGPTTACVWPLAPYIGVTPAADCSKTSVRARFAAMRVANISALRSFRRCASRSKSSIGLRSAAASAATVGPTCSSKPAMRSLDATARSLLPSTRASVCARSKRLRSSTSQRAGILVIGSSFGQRLLLAQQLGRAREQLVGDRFRVDLEAAFGNRGPYLAHLLRVELAAES